MPSTTPDLLGLIERLEHRALPSWGAPGSLRNPDGPEAAHVIRTLEAEKAQLVSEMKLILEAAKRSNELDAKTLAALAAFRASPGGGS